MATYTYQVLGSSQGPIVEVYKDEELVINQPINPETGEPFKTEEEARTYAEQIVKELQAQEMLENPPHLRVQFLNPSTDEVLRVAEVGEPIKVQVELYYPLDKESKEKVYAPVTGKYIVPYYADDVQAGSAVISLVDGKGEGIIKINKSGIFEIKLNRVLNAETMSQPSPLPILEDNPKIAIVEEVTE